jgi:two-component system C4-dicarboxylate transport response regulator DctD
LLRVLQERSVERLGSNTAIPVDCRLVAASKIDLKAASDAGQFRADLYYRLNVVSLDLPPLRQRHEDIPLLMAHFLHEAALRFQRPLANWTPADLARWSAHDWPGNVRELKNVAERWALGLPDALTGNEAQPAAALSLAEQVDAAELRIIETALSRCDGNVGKAAEWLQTPRKTLYDKLARLHIDTERFRTPPAV